MDWQSIFHWLYIAGMSIGAIYFAILGRNPRGLPKLEYFVATFIPIWSGLMYLLMVLPTSGNGLEQGKIEVAGQITHFARYGDWLITTPLLLLALSWTAMYHQSDKDWTLTFSLMATQVVVVISGLIADLSDVPWVRYLWYTIGCVAFLVVMWGIWVPLRAKTRGNAELSSFYKGLTTFFTITWVCYPIIWILGPSGIRLFDQNVDTFLFCLVPFFSKVVFSFLDLNGLRSLGHREEQSGEERFVSSTLRIMNAISSRQPRRSRRRARVFPESF
ncbi:bacteriorhodopsin [Myxacorys almedinensis]|uniref:Bacteriorhodopsin n=1 Tax=Myxacorys almedinensis A TaxID=2690445 RepID=A0A8J8CI44_9CYAN|nr:bacteriorhodopsin [Myxacorys almedinensis]NDJ17373.1 bacteriorhodopsin [Myxacorys almedinensis A]